MGYLDVCHSKVAGFEICHCIVSSSRNATANMRKLEICHYEDFQTIMPLLPPPTFLHSYGFRCRFLMSLPSITPPPATGPVAHLLCPILTRCNTLPGTASSSCRRPLPPATGPVAAFDTGALKESTSSTAALADALSSHGGAAMRCRAMPWSQIWKMANHGH